jgi:hypothetical protein
LILLPLRSVPSQIKGVFPTAAVSAIVVLFR